MTAICLMMTRLAKRLLPFIVVAASDKSREGSVRKIVNFIAGH